MSQVERAGSEAVTEQGCITCHYYVRVRQYDKRGQCRRLSPQIDMRQATGPRSLWPMIRETDFCGEYSKELVKMRVLEAAT